MQDNPEIERLEQLFEEVWQEFLNRQGSMRPDGEARKGYEAVPDEKINLLRDWTIKKITEAEPFKSSNMERRKLMKLLAHFPFLLIDPKDWSTQEKPALPKGEYKELLEMNIEKCSALIGAIEVLLSDGAMENDRTAVEMIEYYDYVKKNLENELDTKIEPRGQILHEIGMFKQNLLCSGLVISENKAIHVIASLAVEIGFEYDVEQEDKPQATERYLGNFKTALKDYLESPKEKSDSTNPRRVPKASTLNPENTIRVLKNVDLFKSRAMLWAANPRPVRLEGLLDE